jgi:DNA polymerase sigma
MSNIKIVSSDWTTTTTILPAAAPHFSSSSSNGFSFCSSPDITSNGNNNIRRKNNNNGTNGTTRNSVARKKQQIHSGPFPLSSSPSPPFSLNSSAEIRPQRKKPKSKKPRSMTNNRSSTAAALSPISSCSLASIATTSSGLSSGASSMGTLNDPDTSNNNPSLPDVCQDTIVKSSSSSAASSAGFGDMTSNDDEDFFISDRSLIINFDDPIFIDSSQQFSRQWSAPSGCCIPGNSGKQGKKSNRKNLHKSSKNNIPNYPNLSNPAVQQFFFEQQRFYRKIYDQQFAVLSAIKLSSASFPYIPSTISMASKTFDRQLSESSKSSNNQYIPHQHLGLPPLPPLPATTVPWLYQLQDPETIPPSQCEEAFLNHLKLHQIPKNPQLPLSPKKPLDIPSMTKIPDSLVKPITIAPATSSMIPPKEKISTDDDHCLAARADFHKQIRERLLAASEKRSDQHQNNLPTTPIKKLQTSTDKLKCTTLSDAAAIAGVSAPPPSLPKGGSLSSGPPKHSNTISTSYASVIQQSTTQIATTPKPTPLNALNLPPLSSSSPLGGGSPKSRTGSSTSSPTKKSKKHGRSFENRLLSTSTPSTKSGSGNHKRNNNQNKNKIEFCMKENDFPPISRLSITSFSKDLSLSSSQKGESGYQSEFSAQCSTADGETDSRCSDPINRDYSSVVANSSKSCTDVSDSKEDDANEYFTADECLSMPDISRMDLLTEHICDYYEKVAQTERTLLKKLRLRDLLYYTISPLFPVCGLYVVGSSLNGFGNENSDMDLCLVITDQELDQRTAAVLVLREVEHNLANLPVVKEQKLIEAKVPILRIKFKGVYENVTVDLNANNAVAIKNTHLLCYYAFFDWRLRPLVAIVKEWAKRCNINDASRSSFTSYSLVLMVIHYLQVGVEKPVLPSLQNVYSKRFNSKNDIRTLNVSLPLGDIPSHCTFERNNDVTLGELLIGFFNYYAHVYDYEKNAISIRLGQQVERKAVIKNHRLQWSPIVIEEPFTRANTAHSIYDERVFEAIKHKFREAHEILSRTHDIKELLSVQPHNVSVMPAMYIPNVLST